MRTPNRCIVAAVAFACGGASAGVPPPRSPAELANFLWSPAPNGNPKAIIDEISQLPVDSLPVLLEEIYRHPRANPEGGAWVGGIVLHTYLQKAGKETVRASLVAKIGDDGAPIMLREELARTIEAWADSDRVDDLQRTVQSLAAVPREGRKLAIWLEGGVADLIEAALRRAEREQRQTDVIRLKQLARLQMEVALPVVLRHSFQGNRIIDGTPVRLCRSILNEEWDKALITGFAVRGVPVPLQLEWLSRMSSAIERSETIGDHVLSLKQRAQQTGTPLSVRDEKLVAKLLEKHGQLRPATSK